MGTPRLEEGSGVGGRVVAQLGAQSHQEIGVGAVSPLCGEDQGGSAFVGVPDTLERLGAVTQAEERTEPLLVGRILQRLIAGEDGFELRRGP